MQTDMHVTTSCILLVGVSIGTELLVLAWYMHMKSSIVS